jgi:RNA polymerase sigma-70 factor (ECF subfamily)
MDPPLQRPAHDARAERFRRMFDEHHPRVRRYALRRCTSAAAAEDAAAEVFLVAWRRLEDVPADSLPWLFATARGVIANQRRGVRRQEALLSRVHWEASLAAQETAPADGELLAGLARLPEAEREALLLVAWEGLDRRRAARAMGCSLPAFAARLHRARRRLAAELARHRTPSPTARIVAEEAS